MRTRTARLAAAVLLLAALLPAAPSVGHDVDELLWAHAPQDHWPTVFVATNVSYHINPWLCDQSSTCEWPADFEHNGKKITVEVPLWRDRWWVRNLPGRGNVDLLVQPWRFVDHDSETWPARAVAASRCELFNNEEIRNCGHVPPPGTGFRFYREHCNLNSAGDACEVANVWRWVTLSNGRLVRREYSNYGLHDIAESADRQEIVEICIDDPTLVAQHTDKATGAVDQAALRADWASNKNALQMRHDQIIGWTGDALKAMSAHNGTPGRLWVWNPDMGFKVMHPATGHGTRSIPLVLFDDDRTWDSTGNKLTCHVHRDDLPIPTDDPDGTDIADYGTELCRAAADRNRIHMRQRYGVVWEDDPTKYARESARAVASGTLPVPWGWTGGRQFRVAELADDSDDSDDWAMVPDDDGIRVSTYVKQNRDFRLDADGQPIWVPNPEQPALQPGEPEWPFCVAPHGF